MIQILRNMKLMQVSRISSPMVALPELLACSKAAAAVQYFRHVHFSFAVFAQLLGNSELPNFRHLVADAAKCFKAFHDASSEVAIMAIRVRGPQAFRRVPEEDGSNADNQLAHVNFALPE